MPKRGSGRNRLVGYVVFYTEWGAQLWSHARHLDLLVGEAFRGNGCMFGIWLDAERPSWIGWMPKCGRLMPTRTKRASRGEPV